MGDHEVIELQIPSSSEYVGVVRNTVGAIAKRMSFQASEIDDLKLAVGEACANAVRHGCPVEGPCTVKVRCHVTKSAIEIEVFNHVNVGTSAPTICAAPDPTREGGMGLFLMRKLMDQVDLQWQDGWATVRMVKNLPDGQVIRNQ